MRGTLRSLHHSYTQGTLKVPSPTTVSTHIHTLQLWIQTRDPRLLAGAAALVLVVALVVWLIVRHRRPSREEMERRRRDRLATSGRITDGSLIDVRTLENEESSSQTPEVLVYRYRLAGVTYECAQDVSRLAEFVHSCHVGSAVQVRYDPRNPGDSILIAETWSGLWLPSSAAGEPLPDALRRPCTRPAP